MIEHLSAVNFRRFEEIDLRFDDDAQLILIDGSNGAGKTSVLEAIHFALWGEGRAGRRRLDALIRRGAELEGMQVELTFQVHGERYRVNRRRDGRSSTAVLYCNEEPLVEGPNEVTEEVGNILGMDAAGFRLAVTAHQGDLEGLVSLRPAERARMVGRLLRLDAIAAAKQAAADQARQERLLASKLAPGLDDGVETELKALQSRLELLEAEQKAAEDAVAALTSQAEAVSGREAEFAAQRELHAGLSARSQLLDQQVEQLEAELAALAAESSDGDEDSFEGVAELEHQVAVLHADLARADASVDRARHRRSLLRDIAEIGERLTALEQTPAPKGPSETPDAVRSDLDAAEAAAEAARRRQDRAEAELQRLQEQRLLGEVCQECGQQVSEEHRARHAKQQQAQQRQQAQQLKELTQEAETADALLAQQRQRMAAATAAEGEHRLAMQSYRQKQEEAAQLRNRRATYEKRIADLPEQQTDPEPLRTRLKELERRLPQARLAEERRVGRARREARRQQVQDQLPALRAQSATAAEEAAAAAPDDALQSAAAESQRLREGIDAERALSQHIATEAAVAKERIAGLRKQQQLRENQAAAAAEHQRSAENAAGAQRILQEAGGQMAQRIRPELEGALNALLEQMSEGRFTRAAIDEEYGVSILDDGAFRDIADLSGGEADLVALALRLALAQVFTARNGGSGAGFLILDECFGSQDPDRRRAILEALRGLRGQYRQIFVISHVEGLEEAADMVLHVQRYNDEPSDVQQAA